MAKFDDLPNKILLQIFSYLCIKELSLCVRNVCTRWRTVSEDDEIWKDMEYFPAASTPEEEIISMLKNMPALRKFRYRGSRNVIQKLSECCRKVINLITPNIKFNAALLKVTMDNLTELRGLHITISPTKDGLELTRIIGQSETLLNLSLFSSGGDSVTPGLLKPIADGCPNLNILRCETFNCSNSEICYLLQRKKHQFDTYEHYGPLSADVLAALNECTNLKTICFTGIEFDGPFNRTPPITNLNNLTTLEVACCRLPMLKVIPLTLFVNTLSHLTGVRIIFASGSIDDLMNKILTKCPLLTVLHLEGNLELTCKGFRNIRYCTLLKSLDVSFCKYVDKKAMKYVAEGCPQLQHLDVSGITISDSMFRQILRCRNLKSLFMWACDLSEINPHLIPTNISGLSYLYIGPHLQLRDDAMSKIKQQMPNLTIKVATSQADKIEYIDRKTGYITGDF
jgi:hypothetical protein